MMRTLCKKSKQSVVFWLLNLAILTVTMSSSLVACTQLKKPDGSQTLTDGGLRIGWGIADITPEGPASLYGQYYERISEYVQSPLKVTACAIETVNGDESKEQAIMVSMDLLNPTQWLQDTLRTVVKNQIPDFDTRKLFLNATHTHSAPDPCDKKYREVCLNASAEAVIAAWKNLQPAGISREVGYAVTGHNRRVEYADGTTEMYGSTERDDFTGMEGGSNSGVDMLFSWDINKKLTGIIINVACPSQVTESKYYVSSDFWGELRKEISKRFAGDVYILPQCGASGDLSPRDLPRGYKSGEPNMWDVPGAVEIGNRLIKTIDEAYFRAQKSIQTSVPFKHVVKELDLPSRKYTEAEYLKAQKIANEILAREPKDPNSPETAWNRFLKETHDNEKIKEYGPWDNKNSDFGILKPYQAIMEYYKQQDKNPIYKMELHVIRLGDIAIATNPFELYSDFGSRMMGRSKAKQTFVVQLASGDYASYLPTERAIKGGGYSATITPVGPDGGTVLVNETVSTINELWK